MNASYKSTPPSDPNNYLAITLLESLGIDTPSQEQIDKTEYFIEKFVHSNRSSSQSLNECLSEDKIAQRLLQQVTD